MSAPGIVRVALVALALMVGAWLAVSVRSSNKEAEGAAIADKATSDTPEDQLDRALQALEDARSFNASREPQIKEVALLIAGRRTGEAARLAEKAVTEEPENAEAWFVLWGAAVARQDAAQVRRALAEVETIDPLRANVMRRVSFPDG